MENRYFSFICSHVRPHKLSTGLENNFHSAHKKAVNTTFFRLVLKMFTKPVFYFLLYWGVVLCSSINNEDTENPEKRGRKYNDITLIFSLLLK